LTSSTYQYTQKPHSLTLLVVSSSYMGRVYLSCSFQTRAGPELAPHQGSGTVLRRRNPKASCIVWNIKLTTDIYIAKTFLTFSTLPSIMPSHEHGERLFEIIHSAPRPDHGKLIVSRQSSLSNFFYIKRCAADTHNS